MCLFITLTQDFLCIILVFPVINLSNDTKLELAQQCHKWDRKDFSGLNENGSQRRIYLNAQSLIRVAMDIVSPHQKNSD